MKQHQQKAKAKGHGCVPLGYKYKSVLKTGSGYCKNLLISDFPTSYIIQQQVQHSQGEGGLCWGETGLLCPPEPTDIVIQQGGFLHTCFMVLKAKNVFYFSTDNKKKHIATLISDFLSCLEICTEKVTLCMF